MFFNLGLYAAPRFRLLGKNTDFSAGFLRVAACRLWFPIQLSGTDLIVAQGFAHDLYFYQDNKNH